MDFQRVLLGVITLVSLYAHRVADSAPGSLDGLGHQPLESGFIVGVGMLFVSEITDLLLFFKTIPIGVRILFALPWIIGLLALSLPVFLVLMWRDGDTSWWGRTHYTLFPILGGVMRQDLTPTPAGQDIPRRPLVLYGRSKQPFPQRAAVVLGGADQVWLVTTWSRSPQSLSRRLTRE